MSTSSRINLGSPNLLGKSNLSILNRIEGKMFPKDDHGYAVVPLRGGGHATIASTRRPHRGTYEDDVFPIIGWYGSTGLLGSWRADGSFNTKKGVISAMDLVDRISTMYTVSQYLVVFAGSDPQGYPNVESIPKGTAAARVIRMTGKIEISREDATTKSILERSGYNLTEVGHKS